MSKLSKVDARRRRHMRVRMKIHGTALRPRMAVYLSNKHMCIQFVDDDTGRTLAAASTLSKSFKESGLRSNTVGAVSLGKMAADAAKQAGVAEVVFDRGGFRYHGKIKAIADSARESGLKL